MSVGEFEFVRESAHLLDPSQSKDRTSYRFRTKREAWEKKLVRRIAITDALVLLAVVMAAILVRFGNSSGTVTSGHEITISYPLLGAFIAAAWWLGLTYADSRRPSILGEGVAEYQAVFYATLRVFGALAIVSVMFKWDMSRGYLAIAFPAGLFGLLITRKLWRRWLHARRAEGTHVARVLVIGGIGSAIPILNWFDRNTYAGLRVTGVWISDGIATDYNDGVQKASRPIPILGQEISIEGALQATEADTVIVTDTEHLGHDGLKQLAWKLEDAGVNFIVAPNVMDVSATRIHLRAVANMPLIHVEESQHHRAASIGKNIFDKVFATAALVAVSPVMLVVAVIIKMTSKGPVFYKSERIGKDSKPFQMIKFRSMVVNAEDMLAALVDEDEGSGPLFKMQNDPRVTRIGRFIRRYSIDELPQLLNVLKGEMSMVGPRPPLRREVDEYDAHAMRRLLVKQGITGLWQVSGRSDLNWDETVRLDLDYVENWSMLRDLQIIWRTVRAVAAKEGAY